MMVEEAIQHIRMLLHRKDLTGTEILIIGVAFQLGYNEGRKTNEKEPPNQ